MNNITDGQRAGLQFLFDNVWTVPENPDAVIAELDARLAEVIKVPALGHTFTAAMNEATDGTWGEDFPTIGAALRGVAEVFGLTVPDVATPWDNAPTRN